MKPGDVVGFRGELGAGKTTAIQAILSSFSVEGGESPTFVMVKPYPLSKPQNGLATIVHVDAYRLKNAKDAETTGLTDVLGDPESIILVEWADRIAPLLPAQTIQVVLRHKGKDAREIEVTR